MKTLTIGAALLIGLAFAAMPGNADHGCNGVITTIPVGPETLYIDDRSEGALTLNHWIYLESNERPGLQSGGMNPWAGQQPILSGEDTACHHDDSDTMIF